MKELLEKLSSYNLFNYLLPGVLFAIFARAFTRYSFELKDLLHSLFLYYFIGLVISRIGSLIIEPALKRLNFLQFANYNNYVIASQQDAQLAILSEANNIYRTFIALFFGIGLLKLYEIAASTCPIVITWGKPVAIIGLILMFLYAYKKQTDYIKRRVDNIIQKRS